MDARTKQDIIRYIRRVDPNGDVVRLIEPTSDFSGGRVSYNGSNLTLGREVSKLTDEEYARAYLCCRLVAEAGYPASSLELERAYSIGRPSAKTARIDLLVKDERPQRAGVQRPVVFLFIEVKAPLKYEQDRRYIKGQLFDLAKQGSPHYIGYYTVQDKGGRLADKLLLIDFSAASTYELWDAAGTPALDRLPVAYGRAVRSTFANIEEAEGELRPLDFEVTRFEFEGLRTELHDVVWGGGGTNNNAVFTHLVKLFLAKIYDEQTTASGDKYRFQRELHDGRPEDPESLFERMEKLYREAQREFLGYSAKRIQQSVGFDRDAVTPQKVAHVVEQVQSISLTRNSTQNEDLLGEFFETIVSAEFTQTKGQFFTPIQLVRFCLAALQLDRLAVDLVSGVENRAKPRLPFICDPSCGSGTFLIEAMKFITTSITAKDLRATGSGRSRAFVGQYASNAQPNAWAREYIYGIENNADLGLATKVNMVLHGDGNINIFIGDGLLPFESYAESGRVHALHASSRPKNHPYDRPLNEQFDVVISNPPFSIKFDKDTERSLPVTFIYGEQKASENLFIERWYQLLREGGRLAVVLPESVADTGENLYIRLFLYKFFRVLGIISLPYLAFQPYTSTKTSIILAQKRSRREIDVWEKEWRRASSEHARLLRVATGQASSSPTDAAEAIRRLVGDDWNATDAILSLTELRRKHAAALTGSKIDPVPWVFTEVAQQSELAHDLFMAEVEEVGYKRGKRRQRRRPNQLYVEGTDGWPLLSKGEPTTVLDSWLARNPFRHDG
ncbi:MAG: N-6 DNA methylase [Spirochaetes bacterium]|nr:N-6 DNA methylase [Spirochaetota bacterium]